jgi:hypothetical protein
MTTYNRVLRRSIMKMSNNSGTWRFFSKNNDSSLCNLCNQTIKRPQSSTTLMQRHLQKYHKAEYQNFIAASKDVIPLKQATIDFDEATKKPILSNRAISNETVDDRFIEISCVAVNIIQKKLRTYMNQSKQYLYQN